MPISFIRQPGTLIALLSGEICLRSLNDHIPVFAEVCEMDDSHVLLDMGCVHRLDDAVTGLLVALRQRLEEDGRALRIAAPAPHIRRILEQARLQDVIVAA